MLSDDVLRVRDVREWVLSIKIDLYSEDDPHKEEKIDLLDQVYDLLCEYEDL